MRMAMLVLVLGITFSFCSETKPHQAADPVLKAAEDLLAVGNKDSRASDKLKILEVEIERAKQRGTPRDLRALPLYDRTVEMFQLSRRKDGSESEELWAASVTQLRKAQLARMGLQNIGPVFYDPPMPKPVRRKAVGNLR